MNKITLIGNLTAEPEIRQTPNGKSVCTFTVAVDRKRTAEKTTDFFRIITWTGLAETCNKFLAKGKKVAVIGELQAHLYEAKNGQARISLDVQADEVEFLTPKSAGGAAPEQKPEEPEQPDTFTDINSDELPF